MALGKNLKFSHEKLIPSQKDPKSSKKEADQLSKGSWKKSIDTESSLSGPGKNGTNGNRFMEEDYDVNPENLSEIAEQKLTRTYLTSGNSANSMKTKTEKPAKKGLSNYDDLDVAEDDNNNGSSGHGLKMRDDPQYMDKQLRKVLFALDAFKKGDISVRLGKEDDNIFAEIAEAYNSMVEMISGVGGEVSRISKIAGVEGNLKARASAEAATGFWKDMINNINGLVDSIAVPVLEVGKVLKNISRGNLDKTFQIPVSGDFKVMAETINKTIDNLNLFAGEVTRVALEVGTEGKLGGQASV